MCLAVLDGIAVEVEVEEDLLLELAQLDRELGYFVVAQAEGSERLQAGNALVHLRNEIMRRTERRESRQLRVLQSLQRMQLVLVQLQRHQIRQPLERTYVLLPVPTPAPRRTTGHSVSRVVAWVGE
jgi:hypothetical protein